MHINNRVVLITGASSGIGAATARAMARRGGCVLLLARNRSGLEQVASEIRAFGGTARTYPVDLSDANAVEQVASTIAGDTGSPDIVVNNAGAGRWLFLEETSPADAVQMMAVPYFAAFYVTRAVLPSMLRRGRGHIVNITSVAAYFAWPGATAYTAARWAMRGFTEALRADLRGTGVSVTLVAAGEVSSPYFEHNPGARERLPKIARFYPTLSPEQVADAIVRSVERNKREVIIPWMHRLTVLQHKLFPWLVEWLLVSSGWKREGAAAKE